MVRERSRVRSSLAAPSHCVPTSGPSGFLRLRPETKLFGAGAAHRACGHWPAGRTGNAHQTSARFAANDSVNTTAVTKISLGMQRRPEELPSSSTAVNKTLRRWSRDETAQRLKPAELRAIARNFIERRLGLRHDGSEVVGDIASVAHTSSPNTRLRRSTRTTPQRLIPRPKRLSHLCVAKLSRHTSYSLDDAGDEHVAKHAEVHR